ncbi:hypothetical protein BCR32DRAFT_329534 [Anaeromyces robustus]|uniref:Phospholipid scramblase n=1 Tax=Anaeromyces robustus TaxID=1754192 RepID=A0A1Y1WRQ4_9FUNG|nr:hypothetical protein BCR32DRAFT_329534 [Anaeromyces robustus]|eukprot:ORX76065.1 hypothetical protein BCR32DRAFT_329534 [Anaeromyces robustus]
MTSNNMQQNQDSSDPPPYTPGPYYAEAPYDTNTKNYNDFINIPDHEIVIIDRKYVTNKHIKYCLREGFSSFSNHTIVILDSERKEQFNCKEKNNQVILYDIDNCPILNAYGEINNYNKTYIYKDAKDDVVYASIECPAKITDDIRNYSINILNKANNKREELEMRFNKFRGYYCVYCNKGKDNEVMIGTIRKSNTSSMKYSIEIAPMVDYMFMLSLGILIIRFETIKRILHQKRTMKYGYLGGLLFR